jgi:hypothetical protein
VPVSGLQVLEGQDALAQHLAVVVEHGEAKHGQLGKDHLQKDICNRSVRFVHGEQRRETRVGRWKKAQYLSKNEGLLVVNWIETIVLDDLGSELFSDGVGRKPVHIHLHVRADLLVGKELAGDHLRANTR